MNKRLKESIIKNHEENKKMFPSLYEQRWVEKAATEGWNDLVKQWEKSIPKLAEKAKYDKGYNPLAAIWYTSFEAALNTFFNQVMDDTVTSFELCIDELQKVTAEIKEKIKED